MGAKCEMPDTYVKWMEQNNVRPLPLIGKKKFYSDLINIDNS